MLDGTAGRALALAVTALGAAGIVGLRAGWVVARPDPDGSVVTTPVSPADVPSEDLTERLRRLHDDHVEKVNMALGEDRDDLVQDLSDSYMDQALRLITAGGRPSPDSLPAR
jgi:hypothetical protein